MKDKTLDQIKKIIGEDGLIIEQERTFALPAKVSLIPELIKLASKEKFKILPLGNETRLDPSRFLDNQTLFLKLSRLSSIKKIVPEDLFVIVEPGLNLKELNSHLLNYNLFYPLSLNNYPGTVGGSVATGLSAAVPGFTSKTSGKEVSTRELVLALEVMNSSGQVLKLGAEVFKSVTGYDTPRLLVGSWGTLGIITSVSLRVFPMNRKKEFTDLRIIPGTSQNPQKKDSSKTTLNQRIKKLLDPEGVFVELLCP